MGKIFDSATQEEINRLAQELANAGEEAIFETKIVRLKLHAKAIKAYEVGDIEVGDLLIGGVDEFDTVEKDLIKRTDETTANYVRHIVADNDRVHQGIKLLQ